MSLLITLAVGALLSPISLGPTSLSPEGAVNGANPDPAAIPVPFPAQEYELAFKRPADQALRTAVKESHELNLVSLTTQFDGGDPVPQPTAMRMQTLFEGQMGDELDAERGWLRRHYLTLEGEVQIVNPNTVAGEDGVANGVTMPLTSNLDSVSVAFVPTENQRDGWGRHYDGVPYRESFLPRVSVPVDWGQYLPMDESGAPRAVKLGETWTLDRALLESLLAPLGQVPWMGDKDADRQIMRALGAGVGGNLHLAFSGEGKGDVTGRLMSVGGDPSGGRAAEIELRFDVSLKADRAGFLQRHGVEGEDLAELKTVGGDLVVGLVGGATIVWDLDAGRPRTVRIVADETVQMGVSVTEPGGRLVRQDMEMRGGLVSTMTLELRPKTTPKRTEVR